MKRYLGQTGDLFNGVVDNLRTGEADDEKTMFRGVRISYFYVL